MILVLGKARSFRVPNLGCRELSHLGDFMFCQHFCMRCDGWARVLSWWSCQSPVVHSCSLLNHWIVSTEECSILMQNLMQIHCSTQSLCMWQPHSTHAHAMASIAPHWPVQWSHHWSHLHIPVHAPWLPVYINVTQTVLIILTMAGLFPDRPRISFKFRFLLPDCRLPIRWHVFGYLHRFRSVSRGRNLRNISEIITAWTEMFSVKFATFTKWVSPYWFDYSVAGSI